MLLSGLRSRFNLVGTALAFRMTFLSKPCVFSLLVPVLVLSSCQFGLAGDGETGLLDFTAKWCGPCQQMSSIVSRLERQGAPIRKVDVDEEPELAAKYRVGSIPCFVLVSEGKELNRISGVTTEDRLVSMLNKLPKAASPVRTVSTLSDDTAGPRLGIAVPITPPAPPKQTERSKNSFLTGPFGFGGGHREKAMAEASEPPTIRAQNLDEVFDPITAAVRIRVKDGTSVNFGSGTIIDSRPGQSVVLTCGHIFRKLSKDAVVEIDVYLNSKTGKPETMIGRVLHSDLDADIGIVTFAATQRLASVKLAPQEKPLAPRERLFSIGCSGGDRPTREDNQLTTINKYDGPENLECTGLPQQGRSGGGLFRGDELVGVCIAADPKQNRGLYTGLKAIGPVLEKVGLENLWPHLPSASSLSGASLAGDLPPADDRMAQNIPAVPVSSLPPGANIEDLNRMLQRELNAAGGETSDDLAGAEVVCIVRSRTPGVPSRVIIVNQASERFVADLLHESRGDTGLRQANRVAPTSSLGASNSRPVETSFEPKRYRRSADEQK